MRYARVTEKEPLPNITGSGPYKAIVVLDEATSGEWRCRVSRWLVESGCLYMMAWGVECSDWDTSVDEANLEAHDYNDVPDTLSLRSSHVRRR